MFPDLSERLVEPYRIGELAQWGEQQRENRGNREEEEKRGADPT